MKHFVNGEFLSLPEIADKYDIALNTLYQRAYRGWRGNELVYKLHTARKQKMVMYEGKEIPVKELAEISGVQEQTLLARMKKGDTGKQLVRPKYSRPDKGVYWNGEKHTIQGFTDKFTNYHISSVCLKLKKGMSPEEIVEQSNRRSNH